MSSALPVYKIKSAGSWGGRFESDGMDFYNFHPKTLCDAKQRAIALNKYASDYIPVHEFKNSRFEGVTDAALAFFYKPPQGWSNISDCGEFPCTGPSNVVMKFTNSLGSVATTFTIVSDLPDSVSTLQTGTEIFSGQKAPESYNGCEYHSDWDAWECSDRKIGVLLFESLDGDTWDRSVQPINITEEVDYSENRYNNILNSAMDHVWDGFYTGQLRLSRFPA